MRKTGHGSRMEAGGMYSSEGEYVEFGNPVLLEGKIMFNHLFWQQLTQKFYFLNKV